MFHFDYCHFSVSVLAPFYNFYLFTGILSLFSSSSWFPFISSSMVFFSNWAQIKPLSSKPNVWASPEMLSASFFPFKELYFLFLCILCFCWKQTLQCAKSGHQILSIPRNCWCCSYVLFSDFLIRTIFLLLCGYWNLWFISLLSASDHSEISVTIWIQAEKERYGEDSDVFSVNCNTPYLRSHFRMRDGNIKVLRWVPGEVVGRLKDTAPVFGGTKSLLLNLAAERQERLSFPAVYQETGGW